MLLLLNKNNNIYENFIRPKIKVLRVIQNIIRVFKEQLDLPVLRLFKLVISGLDRNQFEYE